MRQSWPKPFPWLDRGNSPDERAEVVPDAVEPTFLREVLTWDFRWQRVLYRILVPAKLLASHGIDPIHLVDELERPVAFFHPGSDGSSLRFELFHEGGAPEPMGELELADTLFNQIEVVWVSVQDPSAPRFNIDMTPDGQSTIRGTAARNIEAETAAIAAGLAPGQIRRGLGAFRWLAERIETVMVCLNQREYMAQPLFYHTAILFETCGFAYVQGQARMEEIGAGFAPGGQLRQRLDGSTPFRKQELADSIRGRSWAIHDGVLDRPWDRVRMVKRVGEDAGVRTASDVPW